MLNLTTRPPKLREVPRSNRGSGLVFHFNFFFLSLSLSLSCFANYSEGLKISRYRSLAAECLLAVNYDRITSNIAIKANRGNKGAAMLDRSANASFKPCKLDESSFRENEGGSRGW